MRERQKTPTKGLLPVSRQKKTKTRSWLENFLPTDNFSKGTINDILENRNLGN